MKTQDGDLAAVVARIFEAAHAPVFHRGLVDGPRATRIPPGGEAERAWIEEILPFLRQAVTTIADAAQQDPSPPEPVDALPLALCVLSRDLRLLLRTEKADRQLEATSILEIEAGHLRACGAGRQRALQMAVREAVEGSASRTLSWSDAAGPAPRLLVSPMTLESGEPAALVLIDTDALDADRLRDLLVDTEGLTRSEADVAVQLAEGRSIDEIAEARGCSTHTVRTQVKQAFAKTGTKRQGELIARVLNGPASWLRLVDAEPPEHRRGESGRMSMGGEEGLLELEDGRRLGFSDSGPETGRPVLLCHHLLGSRFETPADPTLLDRLGVRLVVPDRPGIGGSSPLEKRSLATWADDVRQLVDALGLDRFHVLGFSSGGPHAAACAHHLPERVVALGLAGSLMPWDELPPTLPIGLTQRFLSGMARRWPGGTRALLARRYRLQLRDPGAALEALRRSGNAADARVFEDPELGTRRRRDLERAGRVAPEVFADELVMLLRPWGFRLADLRVPIRIWHGRQDDFFPVEQAEVMAAALPDARAGLEADWGHFFFYREWPRLLHELMT